MCSERKQHGPVRAGRDAELQARLGLVAELDRFFKQLFKKTSLVSKAKQPGGRQEATNKKRLQERSPAIKLVACEVPLGEKVG